MAAALAVLDVMEQENLVENAHNVGEYILANLPKSDKIKEVRGRGMMIGMEFHDSVAPIRQALLKDYHIFTGVAGTNMVRLLAPLCLTQEQADRFLSAFKELL